MVFIYSWNRGGACSGPRQSDALKLFGGRDVLQQHLAQASSSCMITNIEGSVMQKGSPAVPQKKKRSIAGIALVGRDKTQSYPSSPVSIGGAGVGGADQCLLPSVSSPKNRRLEWAMTTEVSESGGSCESLDMLALSHQRVPRPSSAGLSEFFLTAAKSDSKRLTFPETASLFQNFTMTLRKDLVELFSDLSVPMPSHVLQLLKGDPLPTSKLSVPSISEPAERVITTTNLIQFLETQQHETCSLDSAREIIQRFENDKILRTHHLLSYEGFAAYMNNASNFAFLSENLMPNEDDMNHPLAHYYIASSHNTYLTGHQLKGIFSNILLFKSNIHGSL